MFDVECEIEDVRAILTSSIKHHTSRIKPLLQCTNPSSASRLPAPRTSSGDHTVVETPVPIPNTVVKHPGPMIVRALAKVGIARFYLTPLGRKAGRGFYFRYDYEGSKVDFTST